MNSVRTYKGHKDGKTFINFIGIDNVFNIG